MRNKELIALLRNDDDETIMQISKDYPGMTDAEYAHTFERIMQEMQEPETSVQTDTPQPSRFAWLHYSAVAAACMLVFVGSFAGLFWMKNHAPVMPEELGQTSVPDSYDAAQPHAIGERYAADHLTASGTLWITVTGAEIKGASCCVSVTLESDGAISRASDTPELFMADNFMAAVKRSGASWVTVQPEQIIIPGETSALPNTITLHSGERRELELVFRADGLPETWMLVTGYNADYPYTIIITEESQ